MISRELIDSIKACQQCPLYKNNPQLTQPLPGVGTINNFVITEKPNFYSMQNDGPDGIEYDLISKIFCEIKKEFYYTHMIKCLGKYSSNDLKTCINWIQEEIKVIKPHIIFTLGSSSKIFTNKKIKDIVGQKITYNNLDVVHIYNPNFILKQGKRELNYFRELIIKYAT